MKKKEGGGVNDNHFSMFEKRWNDYNYHEEKGESINMVQTRNIATPTEILTNHKD